MRGIRVMEKQIDAQIFDVSEKEEIRISSQSYELSLEQIEELRRELDENRKKIETMYFSSDAAIKRIESRSLIDLFKIKLRQLKQNKQHKQLNA